jgi:hypothetical protein
MDALKQKQSDLIVGSCNIAMSISEYARVLSKLGGALSELADIRAELENIQKQIKEMELSAVAE